MLSLVDTLILERRCQEETFAAALYRRLGPPGEAWEEAAAALGLSWERFLYLATTRLPRNGEALAAVAQTFGLDPAVVAELAGNRVTEGCERDARLACPEG
jgi:cobalamin biosynthesis protein CbiG